MIIPPIRNDSMGLGHYGASRGNRLHKGVDLAAYPESLIYTKQRCTVESVGRAYAEEHLAEYKIVNLKIDPFTVLRFFYVIPLVVVGDNLYPGDVFGKVQNRSKASGSNMINHIHVGLKIEGNYADPYPWLLHHGWLEEE